MHIHIVKDTFPEDGHIDLIMVLTGVHFTNYYWCPQHQVSTIIIPRAFINARSIINP